MIKNLLTSFKIYILYYSRITYALFSFNKISLVSHKNSYKMLREYVKAIIYKKTHPKMCLLVNQRLPILPGRLQPSTFGVYELNYCVRDGNRWTLVAIATESVRVCTLKTT